MRPRLATKISVAIVGVVGLAISGSVLALLAVWHIGGLMEDTATENVSSLRAAEELEIALLEQRGLVVSFIFDNENSEWLNELERKKRSFADALDQARKTAHTPNEKRILDELEEAYREYDAKRADMIALRQSGDQDKTVGLFLGEVSSLSRRIDRLSRDFVADNKRFIDSTTARAQRQISRITLLVAGFACLTIGLSITLAWLFFSGVLFPLRKMMAEARDYAGQQTISSPEMPTPRCMPLGSADGGSILRRTPAG